MALKLLRVAPALFAGACACGAPPPPPDARADASIDAAPDAGNDVGLDAPLDSSPDGTIPTDAGDPRAGWPLPEADWIELEGLDDRCLVDRASRPDAVFTPEWIPCEPAVEGCTMLPFAPRPWRREITGDRSAHDGTRGLFWFRLDQGVGTPVHRVLASSEGPPLGAWRNGPVVAEDDSFCALTTAVDVNIDTAGFVLAIGLRRSEEHIFHAPLDAIGTASRAAVVFGADVLLPTNLTQFLRVSSTTIVADVRPSERIVIVEAGRVRVIEAGRELGGIPQNVHLVGRHVFWEDWPGFTDTRIAHATFDDGPAFYYSALPSADIKALDIDQGEMAWTQSSERTPEGRYLRTELWSARYADDPSALRPRFVTEFATRGELARGIYWYGTFRDGRHDMWLWHTADGRVQRLTLPPPWVPIDVLWVTAEGEIALRANNLVEPGRREETVIRLPLGTIPFVDPATALPP